jgi:hypothetical protein
MSDHFGKISNFVTTLLRKTPELREKTLFWPMVQGLNSPIRQTKSKKLK